MGPRNRAGMQPRAPESLADAFKAELAGSLGTGLYAPGKGGVRSGCYSAWVIRNRMPAFPEEQFL